MTENLATWERGISIGAGASLVWLGSRRANGRAALVATGLGLVARGLSGYCPVTAAVAARGTDTRRALGGDRGIHLRERVTIAKPVDAVYAAWRDFSNLPAFMDHVERVDLREDGRTHWVVAGPGGTRLEWDAEVINDLRNELIAWRSLEGADVVSAGSVRFEPAANGGTEVRLHLQYAPPAGKAGAWLASWLGENPAERVREDLRRFKHRLESGSSLEAARAF
jgi:uncharacterized membrane protein